jgi:hypothetical protein
MKVAYLLHNKRTHFAKADWLAAHYPVDSFVVIYKTRAWWGQYLWARARRIGLANVVDQVAFRLYWILVRSFFDQMRIKTLLERLGRDLPNGYKRPPVYCLRNINSNEGEALLRKLAPDVCILTIHPILEERIFSIPSLGMLVFHPGVVPEYRGPHSAFWATLNNEFWGIGWSLIKIDTGIDTGEVVMQGSSEDLDPLSESHIYMQHKSHIDGLPKVVEVLRKLEIGECPRVSTKGRVSTNHTHPGMTDYVKLRKRIKRLRTDSGHVRQQPTS